MSALCRGNYRYTGIHTPDLFVIIIKHYKLFYRGNETHFFLNETQF